MAMAAAGKSAVVKPICRTIKVARGGKWESGKWESGNGLRQRQWRTEAEAAQAAQMQLEHAALMSEYLRFGCVIW